MGYSAVPVRQRVVFHPLLAPAFGRASHAMLKWLRQKWPQSPTLAKAEGLVRFHLKGKRPLDQQPWPEGLADRKTELLRIDESQPDRLLVQRESECL
jgi:hypothetical protein